MSSSPEIAKVSLSSSGALGFSLVDSSFREVAHGTGSLQAELDPGIYELRVSAGPETRSRLLTLRGGQVHAEAVELAFPSAVPMPGTTTWNALHEEAATQASNYVAALPPGPGDGGLVIMVRTTTVATPPDAPVAISVRAGTAATEVQLPFSLHAQDYQLLAGRVPAGGYTLRGVRNIDEVEQSVWVARGWQTLVFVPMTQRGLSPSRSSVVMVPLQETWDPSLTQPAGQASELALWGLREGRSVVPPNLLDLLLHGKFRDPMLGLLGAHSLLLAPQIDFGRFDIVLNNCSELLPDSPDVMALRALGEEARRRATFGPSSPRPPISPPPAPVEWPPMLIRGYIALIRLDVETRGGVLARGSAAHTVAERLSTSGVWTVWRTQERPRTRRRTPRSEETLLAGQLRTSDWTTDATERVAEYLATVAEVQRPAKLRDLLGEDVSAYTLASEMAMPLDTAEKALGEISDRVV